ncbi:putative aldouronate transport system substrate-binding protein [Scopulibacillus darangshiensis]|uniref:Putative aldouronate transport system substrate-binding protein n=1 Tax=Scopulibacillus darangshiensis TaxID=442528 RepID=A0A4R2NWL2_9BACL|nr:extracellular solute-binding protein [Scopulibacillus darangshiensis]TCP25984.1 putative aldouronate transport system substrate-binding protein [Scopulibacillus darangshiensis]
MIKKSVMFFMAIVLLLGILAGCQSSNDTNASKKEPGKAFNKTGYPIVDKKVTMTMFGPNVGLTQWKDMQFFKTMEKKTNVHFKFKTPPSESLDTKKNLTFASGDLPDVFYGASLTQEEQVKYGSQGILIPLEDLIKDYAPHIQKMLDEHPDIKKAITTDDGHIYALPYVNQALPWARGPMWYNGKFLKNLGVKELPKTTEELYDLLKRFKTEDPNKNGKADEIPLTGFKIEDIRQWFLGAFGVADPKVELVDGKVKYGAIQPGYKDYLVYMHKLWKEGLLDHETFSQTAEQKQAKGHDNRLGLFADWFPHFTLGGSDSSTKNPMMVPVKGPNVDKPIIPISSGISGGQFAITNKNDHPAAAIRWADYSYSKEGSNFLHYGKEGDFWKWGNKDKNIRTHVDPPKGFESGEEYRGTLTPDYGIPVPTWTRTEDEKGWDDPFTQFIYKQTDEKIRPYGQVPFPPVFLKKNESSEISRISSDLDTYWQQMEAKFITGQKPISDWDKYVKTIKKMDVDKLVDIYSKAYKRYQKK